MVTGTPTTAGAYSFSVTASNAYGGVVGNYAGVFAAPLLELALDFAAGSDLDDASVTISGSGLVGSTFDLVVYSAPVTLLSGSIATNPVNFPVSIPVTTPTGAHEARLTLRAPDGSLLTRSVWFSVLANGTIGAVSAAGPVSYSELAATGSESAVPLGLTAMLLLMLGAVFALAARRPSRRS